MKAKVKKYRFKAQVWKFKGKGGWHFITLPKNISRKIHVHHGLDEEGWGRLKSVAQIGKSKWNTAIWYDSKFEAYLLPVKATVRKSEKIEAESTVAVTLTLEDSAVLKARLGRLT